MNEVVNSNMDGFQCILVKLVSGEEIITHVDAEDLYNEDMDFVTLHDPYKVAVHGNNIVLVHWIITSSKSAQIVCKKDFLVLTEPDSRYAELYEKLITEKYQEDLDDDDFGFDWNGFINGGTDSIN